ncbi:MAG: DUF6691 family protein [Novosphingobium meiothermophilum]
MRTLVAFMAGLAFGFGLLVSGMSSPAKVLAFLDLAGTWNPSLAFVMGGAVITATPLFWLANRRQRPLVGEAYDKPDRQMLDRRLIGGAVLFGVGWGLAGICPGPAVVDLVLAPAATAPFMAAMIAGIMLSARMRRAPQRPDAPEPGQP